MSLLIEVRGESNGRGHRRVEPSSPIVPCGPAGWKVPLFLHPDRYVNVPLEATYNAAYRGVPAFWRDVLEGRQTLA